MSTNARITIKELDGTRKSIYLHWDGYVERAGVILQLAYNSADKVRELINLGDLSELGFYIEPKTENHSFDTPDKDVCVAYHRDRGEGLNFNSERQEYNYIFDTNDSRWYLEGDDTRYILLDEIIGLSDHLDFYWQYDGFYRAIKWSIDMAKEAVHN